MAHSSTGGSRPAKRTSLKPLRNKTALLKSLLWMAAAAGLAPDAQAVMKCLADGKTWYQDAPCPQGTTTRPMQLDPPPASPGPLREAMPTEPATKPASAPAPQALSPSSMLEEEARMCLDWYQKNAGLPPGATYLSATKDRRVVTLVVAAPVSMTNHTGARVQGTTQTPASCEINGGKIDDGWTRTHARRGNWIQ